MTFASLSLFFKDIAVTNNKISSFFFSSLRHFHQATHFNTFRVNTLTKHEKTCTKRLDFSFSGLLDFLSLKVFDYECIFCIKFVVVVSIFHDTTSQQRVIFSFLKALNGTVSDILVL